MRELDLYRVGEKISFIRRQKGYTLKELSEYTGLSVGYLSNLETGKTSPTLDNLNLVALALQTDLIDLIISEKQKKLMVKRDEMRLTRYDSYNMEVYFIDFGYDPQLYEIIRIRSGEGKKGPTARHVYSEVCTVLDGELTVEVDKKIYKLGQYDSIYIPAQSPHRMWNEGDKEVVSYWVYHKTAGQTGQR